MSSTSASWQTDTGAQRDDADDAIDHHSTVRAGLAAGDTARAYRLPTARLGLRPGLSLDGASRLTAAMEDDELVRRLELRK